MIQSIEVNVSRCFNGKLEKLFGKSIDLDFAVNYPYNQIVDTFRFLYGNDVIITFSQVIES